MHSLFEISEKRPVFEDNSGCESLDFQSDDEFVLIWEKKISNFIKK